MHEYSNKSWRIFWELTKGYRGWAFTNIILVMLETVSNVTMPFLIGYLIDAINRPLDQIQQNINKVYLYGGLLILFAILGLSLGLIAGVAASKSAAGLGKNIRSALFYKASRFSFENIDKYSVATLINRMGNDVTNITNAFNKMIRIPFRATFLLVLNLVFSISASPQLSVMFLVILPMLIIFTSLIWWKTYPVFKSMFKVYDDLNHKIQENLQGMRTIKSYVTEKKEAKSIFEKVAKLTKINIYVEHGLVLGVPAFMVPIFTATLFLGGYGTHLVLNGSITTGTIVSFSSYIWQTSVAVTMFIGVVGETVIAGPSAKRVFEVIKEVPSISENLNGLKQVANGNVEFKNVSLRYTSNKGNSLRNVSFSVASGKTLGIVGRTGGGKTSLVSLIGRLYEASEGEVLVGGKNVKEYNIHSLRDAVAIVLQKNSLFSGTIRDNMRWGNQNATDEEIYQALGQSGILDYVMQLENKLDTIVDQGGVNFSGGQKQRLCIARALIKNPKILILDDSTSAVDTKTERLIQEALTQEIKDCTKIIIAQRISSVIHADEIIVVDQGEIVAQGTHEQLIKNNEFYNSIYQAQLNAGGINED
ncbi:ABC transporter ATP-binding protein/permease [Mycoplasmopsis citelli]|uniref:ABC-type multidrug/protein/lipid transport system ATPase component n=1 Tax=Mycoplasmopsis citelli TaxID=171281 RepID=A0A449B2N7_9BACT|nr:ABC transporter ATP-binding protein [Mycoplasmopsis citelli]UUD36543.1 ABC transporter ATP-binding protein/permease [Mycoplasmopsis citelli]VEU74850.1 ABC-type multidrug/protein/lipid transport system ATPase component [Mycoplasmopsis citelli]